MSKPVRLPEYLYEELQKLAAQEKRSLANMVAVLLEQSLRLEKGGMARIMDGDEPVGVVFPADVDAQPRQADPHFKPDPK